LNEDKAKLSKRHGDVAIKDHHSKGYLPQALVNFVVLLGWNPGGGSTEEVFSMERLVEEVG
jgi:glutamyl/glutaminyl-tRNA synthetase